MESIALGRITILVGPNNAGKSSLLRGIYAMQEGTGNLSADLRLGSNEAIVNLSLEAISGLTRGSGDRVDGAGDLTITITSDGGTALTMAQSTPSGHDTMNIARLPAIEPGHFVVPYLSKRKPLDYQEDVREQFALAVTPQFDHLAAKLSRLGNPSFPSHERYRRTCEALLGFVVTAIPSRNGQRPGVYVTETESIPLSQMGDGVPNIVALLAELALSHGKLFLIEEPENDLHPKALKALLDLIVESAEHNQFVVSTHSNIVARHLGAADDSRLYYVDGEPGKLPPVAHVKEVEPTPAARLGVLKDLGYTFSDFDLWDGWLILEESSAERIIRDYLIPFFTTKLARIRTLAAGGNQEVEPTFDDFYRLVRFTHLEEAYRNRAWVLVDGDTHGREIVERLRERYSTWEPDRFGCFDQAQFERYYPSEFSDRVDQVLSETNRPARREAKRVLLDDVRQWLDEDEDRAHVALTKSAAPVIATLKRIEAQL